MFDGRNVGCEQFEDVASDHSGATGVQPLRVTPLHFQGGSWAIPSISHLVPKVIKPTHQDQVAAAFSLEADANGICLPKGKFTDLHSTLQKQFALASEQGMAKDDPLSMRLHLEITGSKVEVVLLATSYLTTIKLAPLVTRLNAASDGLGWFVYQQIEASVADGFPIYSPSHMICLMEMLWFEPGMTDAEFAEFLKDQYGPEEANGMTAEDFIEHYGPPHSPSTVQESLGELVWILPETDGNPAIKDRPFIPAMEDVVRLMETMEEGDLKDVVKDTLQMSKEVQRESSNLKSKKKELQDEYGGMANPYGASCILLWDKENVFYDLIQGYEESEMNGGEATEVHMMFEGDLDDQESITDLLQSFKDVVARYQAVSHVLKHFK